MTWFVLFSFVLVMTLGCAVNPSDNMAVRAESSPLVLSASSPTPEESDSSVINERQAIEIALKTWIPVYGQKAIEDEKPYVAELENGVWYVHGSLPGKPENWVGGVAEAWISQKNGQVIRFYHGK